MLEYERLAHDILRPTDTDSAEKSDTPTTDQRLAALTAPELAVLFVKSAFLTSLSRALIDQDWVLTKHEAEHRALTQNVLKRQLSSELKSLLFVSDLLIDATPAQLKQLSESSQILTAHATSLARKASRHETADFFSLFVRSCIKKMAELLEDQNSIPENPFLESTYRAFDSVDEILGLDYSLDNGMKANEGERLYEGGGVGVQTSYSTLLLTFAALHLKPGAHVVDLGSGFGRVGLTLGLLREDIHFIGYEFVDHRVRSSEAAAMRAGLQKIKFITQDLSDPAFRIPVADTYYMYDPFNEETYRYILNQMLEIGIRNCVKVVTKGRANTWASDALVSGGWTFETTCDNGSVNVFSSNPTVSF